MPNDKEILSHDIILDFINLDSLKEKINFIKKILKKGVDENNHHFFKLAGLCADRLSDDIWFAYLRMESEVISNEKSCK